MATTTTNLGLTKPAAGDYYDIGVFNGNFDAIDEAVAGKQEAIDAQGLLKRDAEGDIVKAVEGTDYAKPAVDKTATLSTTWTGASAPYTQDVLIDGLLAADKIEVGLADNATAAQVTAAAAALLMCTGKAAGQITITAFYSKPAVALPIIVRVVG